MRHLVLMADDANARLNEDIRKRAGYGTPAEQLPDVSAEPEQVRAVDFGAGVRRSIQPELSMSDLMRAAYTGLPVQMGGR